MNFKKSDGLDMAEVVPSIIEQIFLSHDIVEQILVRLDVLDLIQFKCVCKSWHSYISNPRFVKAHLNHNDRSSNEFVQRRIVMSRPCFSNAYIWSMNAFPIHDLELDHYTYDRGNCHLLGSSNGLVCISPADYQFLVANPSTREVKKLQTPNFEYDKTSITWGFGYDSYTDDYKVTIGVSKDDFTRFHVLSLKSNVWKVVGYVKYTRMSRLGTLCNGALHWFMSSVPEDGENAVILSLSLSNEEFKVIPRPPNPDFLLLLWRTRLGICEGCLCIYNMYSKTSDRWVMRSYNVQESWEFMSPRYKRMELNTAHVLKELKDYIPHRDSFCEDFILPSRLWPYLGSPLYVQSLVSPNVNHGTLKTKMHANHSKMNDKLIKREPSVT